MPIRHELTLIGQVESHAAVLLQDESGEVLDDPVCRLELQFNGKQFQASGPDFFEALLGIRRQLEPAGLLVQIYGGSRNVWPSGMSRSMGLGVQAYKMAKGKQALMRDLVDIFATGADVEPVTIAEQEKFRDEWFASLGRET
jgi:hypothetical protein